MTGRDVDQATSAPWAVVEFIPELIPELSPTTGEIGATAIVAGLSLVARHARVAARARLGGVRFVCPDDGIRDDVLAALTRRPAPRGFAVDVVVGDDTGAGPAPPAVVRLTALAVYTAEAVARAAAAGEPPAPLATITTRADARAVERELQRAFRKSVDADGVVAYHVARRVSRAVTPLLVRTAITPNQVTLVALACGLVAAGLAATGGYAACVAAGLLLFAGSVIDCMDGEIARLRLEFSKAGEWLDSIADDLSTFGVLAGLGVGLARSGAGEIWWWVGPGGAVVGLATQAWLYRDLHRRRLPIDTAQYPWFFGTPSSSGTLRRGVVAQVVRAIGFGFRRDAFVVLVALGLAFDLRRTVTVVMCGGGLLVTLLVVAQLLVGGRRPVT